LRHVPLWLLLLIAGCTGRTSAGIPPCSAFIVMFGTADLTLDCPAHQVLPILERRIEQTPATN